MKENTSGVWISHHPIVMPREGKKKKKKCRQCMNITLPIDTQEGKRKKIWWRGGETTSSWDQVWGGNATVQCGMMMGMHDYDRLRYKEQVRPGTATIGGMWISHCLLSLLMLGEGKRRRT